MTGAGREVGVHRALGVARRSGHLLERGDVNVFGVINGMKVVLPDMVSRGQGHVVDVASLAGKFPVKGLAVYSASKFAVVGLTAATRLEHEDDVVSISAVLPSAVRTELAPGIDYGLLPAVDPEDIAAAIVRSLRDDAAINRVYRSVRQGYVDRILKQS